MRITAKSTRTTRQLLATYVVITSAMEHPKLDVVGFYSDSLALSIISCFDGICWFASSNRLHFGRIGLCIGFEDF